MIRERTLQDHLVHEDSPDIQVTVADPLILIVRKEKRMAKKAPTHKAELNEPTAQEVEEASTYRAFQLLFSIIASHRPDFAYRELALHLAVYFTHLQSMPMKHEKDVRSVHIPAIREIAALRSTIDAEMKPKLKSATTAKKVESLFAEMLAKHFPWIIDGYLSTLRGNRE